MDSDALGPRSEAFKHALGLALARLRGRDRFAREVLDSLVQGGVPPETAAEVVSYLQERRFVDDRRTTTNLIAGRSGRQASGKEKLRADLVRRGAPGEIVDEALAEIAAGDEVEAAVVLLGGKYRPDADSGRAGRFLASRGYSAEVIGRALGKFFESLDGDE